MLKFLIFLIASSVTLAKLEINIEGKNGWARKLPTWKLKNWLTKIICGDLPLTGYHFWIMGLTLLLLHFPFISFQTWSINQELLTMALFFFIWVLEDFLWFVFNPHFGLKKFNRQYIDWYQRWFMKLPTSYYKFVLIGSLLLFLSQSV